MSTVVTPMWVELTRPLAQPLEPFKFDKDDIEGLTRRLVELVCEPTKGEEYDQSETEVRLSSCC